MLNDADERIETGRSDLVREGLDLIAAYRRIENIENRRLILQLVQTLADAKKGERF